MKLHRTMSAVVSLTIIAAGLVCVAPTASAATGRSYIDRTVIGYSVHHRPIVAYHLGDPRITIRSVIIGQIHGDEHAGVTLTQSILNHGAALSNVNIWLIPTMNPDGDAAHTRQNAHGVDLNRNWPASWRALTGQFYSGPKALSEPETSSMARWLTHIKPHYLMIVHQPLNGVDKSDGGPNDAALRARVAKNLGLSQKSFVCSSRCYGSLPDWYTHRHHWGASLTVEFGSSPSHSYLVTTGANGLLKAFGAKYVANAAKNPITSMKAVITGSRVTLAGTGYDTDSPAAALQFRVSRDGAHVSTFRTTVVNTTLNRTHRLTGAHGVAVTLTSSSGRHTYCETFLNIGAGTGSTTRCQTVSVKPKPTPTQSPTPKPSSTPSPAATATTFPQASLAG